MATPSRRLKTPKDLTLNTGDGKVFVPASASRNERGYVVGTPNQSNWWSDLANERTSDVRWPLSVRVYDDMVRQDAQISSVLSAVYSPILRTTWRIDGAGCDPRVTAHIAADLGLPIVGGDPNVAAIRTRDRFSWTKHLEVAIPTMLQYGHAPFEQVYSAGDPVNDTVYAPWHLKKLAFRPPRTIANWGIRPDGTLASIQQWTPAYSGTMMVGFGGLAAGPIIPENSLVVYVNRLQGGNWMGMSVLRPAYKNWLLKDYLLRTQAQVLERNGMGLPVHTAAGGSEAELEAGLSIATAARAGDSSGVSLANGAKFELVGISGKLPDILPTIQYLDEQIARAVLAHFLNLGTQTGSWALGSTFADFFTLSIQTHAENFRDTAQQHIIEDLVDINYGPNEPAPRLVFDEIGTRRAEILASINSFVAAGVIRPDEDLEAFVRSSLDLPQANGTPFLPDPKTTIQEQTTQEGL